MKNLLPVLAIFGWSVGIAQNLELDWATGMGGSGGTAFGYDICTDAQGNVYTTGYFIDTVYFGPGPGAQTLIAAWGDIFGMKQDENGAVLWVQQIGGSYLDGVWNTWGPLLDSEFGSVNVDEEGNLYTTGVVGGGTVDLDPGSGVYEVVGKGTFIQKLDGDGNFIWARHFYSNSGNPSNSSVNGNASRLDATGNIYTIGTFPYGADFDPGLDTAMISTTGDVFVLKLDSNGDFVWVKNWGGNLSYGSSLALDSQGNVYSIGLFTGVVDFDPGPEIFEMEQPVSNGAFIQKMNSDGQFLWAKSVTNQGLTMASVTTDQQDNIYVTGCFLGSQDFDYSGTENIRSSAGGYDLFVQKFNPAGDLLWVHTSGGVVNECVRDIRVHNEFVVVSGESHTEGGQGQFGSTLRLWPYNFGDGIMLLLDTTGNVVRTDTLRSATLNGGSAVTSDAMGTIYVTGFFGDTVDFDFSDATYPLEATGNYDLFVMKLLNNSYPVGLESESITDGVLLYPNPSTGIMNIQLSDPQEDVRVVVYTIDGKEMASSSFGAGQTFSMTLDIPSGMYFAQIIKSTSLTVKKIQKH